MVSAEGQLKQDQPAGAKNQLTSAILLYFPNCEIYYKNLQRSGRHCECWPRSQKLRNC